MAAGDISSRTVYGGNVRMMSGLIDVDTTARVFALLDTKSRIIAAQVSAEDDGAGSVNVMINSNNGTADTAMGSIWVDASADINANYVIWYQ